MIEDIVESLNGAVWFTALDLKSGFWKVQMDEASKQLMAFLVHLLGFYECDHIPFKLVNAPATFQRLMETCLGDLQLTQCLIYLKDIIVFSKNAKRSPSPIESSFQKKQTKEAGLKLRPSKCEFLRNHLHTWDTEFQKGVLKLMTAKLK